MLNSWIQLKTNDFSTKTIISSLKTFVYQNKFHDYFIQKLFLNNKLKYVKDYIIKIIQLYCLITSLVYKEGLNIE